MWNLFEQQPMLLEHPSGRKFAVAAVSRRKDGTIGWWSADYLINQNSTGFGGSGFPFNPTCAAEEWDEAENCWKSVDTPDWVYKFRLPTEEMLRQWEQYKQYVPDAQTLQRMVEE